MLMISLVFLIFSTYVRATHGQGQKLRDGFTRFSVDVRVGWRSTFELILVMEKMREIYPQIWDKNDGILIQGGKQTENDSQWFVFSSRR